METRQTILLLINPLANKKKIEKISTQVSNVLFQRKIDFNCFTQSWPAGINIYKEVWLIGSDGTVNYFLNCYKNIEISIVIFKGDRNDFTTRLYGSMSIDE